MGRYWRGALSSKNITSVNSDFTIPFSVRMPKFDCLMIGGSSTENSPLTVPIILPDLQSLELNGFTLVVCLQTWLVSFLGTYVLESSIVFGSVDISFTQQVQSLFEFHWCFMVIQM